MSLFESIFLGAFQGIAEFLPISSSGHLLLLKNIFGLSDVPVLFDVLLHVATLLSILVVFWKRVWGIIVSVCRFIAKKSDETDSENLSIVIPAIIATVVTAVVGLIIKKLDFLNTPKIASGFLLVTAIILISTSFVKKQGVGYKKMGIKRSLFIGLAQGIGVLPGISRSGITISAGLASGLDRETSGEFSFLLAIPAILGALVLDIGDVGKLTSSISIVALIVSCFVAFIVGVLSLKLMMPLIKKGKLAWFAIYLIPVGLIGLFIL